jgi:hypothetical protein
MQSVLPPGNGLDTNEVSCLILGRETNIEIMVYLDMILCTVVEEYQH